MITYKKLKDESWGVIGPQSELKPGAVTVTKKDGSTKQETVKAVSKPFDVDGIQTVIGYLVPKPRKRSSNCGCDADCCQPYCRCDSTCNCRGGNIYDC